MAAEPGHDVNRVYISQAGDLHLNGGKVWDASEVDITATLNGVAVAAVAGVAEASKVPVLGTTKNLDVLVVAAFTATTAIVVAGASTVALGTNTGTAAALPAGTSSVYPTTAADDTVGVVVSASDKVTGRLLFIGNGVSNKILKVYPAAGGTINGAGADVAFSSASGKGVILYCLSSVANTWLAW